MIVQFFKCPGLSPSAEDAARSKIKAVTDSVDNINTELCYYVECSSGEAIILKLLK